MPKNLRFWSNVALIASAHVAIIVGLVRWSARTKDAGAQSVVWMNGGAGDGVVSQTKNPQITRSPPPRKESKSEPVRLPETDDDRPFLASAPSEIQLPSLKPSPTPTAAPARPPKPRPKETPKPTSKPTPTAKPTAKPTPKASPKKMTLVKASPKSSPVSKPPLERTEDDQAAVETEKKEIARAIPVKNDSVEKDSKKTGATQTGSGRGSSTGAGDGHSGGAGSQSQFGWYGSMLHDRFYSEWIQPTTVASAGTKNSVLVKLRIEKDGRVSSFEIVRPSGNADLDDSVKAIANRVTQVEPLPDGLGKDDHYDVKINFELNSE